MGKEDAERKGQYQRLDGALRGLMINKRDNERWDRIRGIYHKSDSYKQDREYAERTPREEWCEAFSRRWEGK